MHFRLIFGLLRIKVFMPPTSKKLGGHIASGLFVRPSVRSSHFLMHSVTLEP